MITITKTKSRALLAGLAVLAAALWSEPTAAQSERMELEIDEGQIIRLPRPAQNIFIGNPKVADVTVMSPRIIYVFGKKTGGTTFYAIDGNERIMIKRDIVVGHNLGRLREELDRIVPGGRIQVASVNGGIVLHGEVETERQSEDAKLLAERFLASDEEKVVNRLRVTMPNQVSIRVRVAEVTKNLLEQLSLSWENFYDGQFLLGLATGNPVLASTAAGSATISPPLVGDENFITRTGTEVDSFYGGGSAGDFDINGVIDVLSEDGLVTILAEPNLTAVSGETASFLAGGEFPIAIATDDTITIEFKEFGVSLAFTPTVLDDRRISLLVRPEVSELATENEVTVGNFVVRALFVRRA
ncbi:MAG: pilus assembly protein N-terminal domain-containing protein, partial [Kiloniellales bacterium]|nr:pilus assembly protein N-terminal domain-containing protein [Kiloniellales bacterium]